VCNYSVLAVNALRDKLFALCFYSRDEKGSTRGERSQEAAQLIPVKERTGITIMT
jgi:hypothetical protein